MAGCDFYSPTTLDIRSSYVDALICEIEHRRVEIDTLPFVNSSENTLYLGGGTPSLLSFDLLCKITCSFSNMIQFKELSIEVNPDDISYDYSLQLRQLGFNRISIGVQSFNDKFLTMLGRRHNALQAINAVLTAYKTGFDNISVDLMYALPNQSLRDWENDIDTVLKLPVNHISTYCLTLEPHVPLFKKYENGQYEFPNEQLANNMFDLAITKLSHLGFQHYEISNFCLRDTFSIHNRNYWNDVPYLGFGPSAHSYDGETRYWNTSNLDQYLEQAQSKNFKLEREKLTREQKDMEKVMLGLRTITGVNEKYIHNKSKMEVFIQNGLLFRQGTNLCATQKGMHILNYIIKNLI